jgi:hypothetical protein
LSRCKRETSSRCKAKRWKWGARSDLRPSFAKGSHFSHRLLRMVRSKHNAKVGKFKWKGKNFYFLLDVVPDQFDVADVLDRKILCDWFEDNRRPELAIAYRKTI